MQLVRPRARRLSQSLRRLPFAVSHENSRRLAQRINAAVPKNVCKSRARGQLCRRKGFLPKDRDKSRAAHHGNERLMQRGRRVRLFAAYARYCCCNVQHSRFHADAIAEVFRAIICIKTGHWPARMVVAEETEQILMRTAQDEDQKDVI